jgi:hypothetical protein
MKQMVPSHVRRRNDASLSRSLRERRANSGVPSGLEFGDPSLREWREPELSPALCRNPGQNCLGIFMRAQLIVGRPQ